MENLERLLREHDFLQGLSAPQIASLISCVQNVRVDAGAFLMREGDEAGKFYLLRRGRVALEVDAPGKGPIVMESLGPGDILGLSWLFPPNRVHIDARALEPVVALEFDGICLRGKMEADHDLGFALTRRLLAETYTRLQRVRLQRLDVYTSP